ncbi:hypothetical protein [Novosphingobium clariflavum]|uniref:Uncharacterized protein n=1 Tax=Novosphingobium clariflavum TaxID=2029884 RepID=A0ABV6SEJ7_9SPHN|nr:hypothetical protein [Novosphingobium clariflavum]
MANRVLYVGAKAAFCRAAGATDNTGSWRDTAYTDTYIDISGATAYCYFDFLNEDTGESDAAVAGETLWLRMDWGRNNDWGTASICEFVDDQDRPLVRFYNAINGQTVYAQYNSGTFAAPVWTNISNVVVTVPYAHGEMACRLKIGEDGNHTFTLWQEQILVIPETPFSMSALTRVDAVVVHGNSGSNNGYAFSQVLATVGINTIGSKVAYRGPDAAGTYNTFDNGDYTAIDDTALNDSDGAASGTEGERLTFGVANAPAIPVGLIDINRVWFGLRGKMETTGPMGLKPIVISGGSETVGDTIMLTEGISGRPIPYRITYSAFNATGFEMGFESAA